MRGRAVVAVAAVIMMSRTVSAVCVGDCGGDDAVGVNDIVKGVNIALGSVPVGQCGSFDANGDGRVGINELITAVGNALNGCGFVTPTPTATGTPGPPTATPTQVLPSATATSAVVPPGVDSRLLHTFSGIVRNQNGDTKSVRLEVKVVNNQVRITDLGRNFFTASGAQTVTMMVLNPTTLSYEHAEAPRFAEIFQCGLGNNSLVVQYTTTNFSFPPTATSFAGELPSEG